MPQRKQRRSGSAIGIAWAEVWARVPQDIVSEVVSGHESAIPAPPTPSRSGPRKQEAGAVSGPADGVAVPSGPWCQRHQGPSACPTGDTHGRQRGAMTADNPGRLDDDHYPAYT